MDKTVYEKHIKQTHKTKQLDYTSNTALIHPSFSGLLVT